MWLYPLPAIARVPGLRVHRDHAAEVDASIRLALVVVAVGTVLYLIRRRAEGPARP